MSKRRRQTRSTCKSRFSWNVVQAIATVGAVLLALIAVWQASIANRAAKRANEIAENSSIVAETANSISEQANQIAVAANELVSTDSQSSIEIQFLESLLQTRPSRMDPCILGATQDGKPLNEATWSWSFAPLLDITNTGGRATSLVGFWAQSDAILEMIPELKGANASVWAFDSTEAYQAWIETYSSGRYSSISFGTGGHSTDPGNISATGLPLTISPGETIRLALEGIAWMQFYEISPRELLVRHPNGFSWSPEVTFFFGDGTSKVVEIAAPTPYPGDEDYGSAPDAFEQCKTLP